MASRLSRIVLAMGIGAAGTPFAAPLFAQPDLVVDQPALASTWFVQDVAFPSSSCALVEACIGAPGVRRLLLFDTLSANIAQTDLFLGDPANNPHFIFSPCHGHYHFEGFSNYQLLDSLGDPAAPGHKQAFCLTDFMPYVSAPWVPSNPFFGCDFQGLQRGWADLYDSSLDCQWIDVTNVPAGSYVLKVVVNPEAILAESDLTNNTSMVPVTLPAPAGIPPRPDGRLIPGSPLRVSPSGSLDRIDFDATNCPALDYNLYYGFRSGAWSYSYAGAVCGLGRSGSALVDLPEPASGFMVWFLVVGADPFHTPVKEGGHGFDSTGRERPLTGVGFCSVARTQSGPWCAALSGP